MSGSRGPTLSRSTANAAVSFRTHKVDHSRHSYLKAWSNVSSFVRDMYGSDHRRP